MTRAATTASTTSKSTTTAKSTLRRRTTALLALVALGLVGGCVNHDVHLYEARIHGTIAPAGPIVKGEVHVVLHHARAGEGATSHPLGPFDEVILARAGSIDETILVPTDDGEGLVIYAWQDLDGDGALCAPAGAIEVAGLMVVDDFPRHDVELELVLAAPCAGPEALYP